MTDVIRREIISDIKKICAKFGISQVINEEKRDEILKEQYENLKFPVTFYNIYIENAGNPIEIGEKEYCCDEEIEILLTSESREKTNSFNMLYLFLANTKATNDFFEDRKHKRKIRKVFKITETVFDFKGRRYYRQVLQFNYFAEHLINKDFKEE